MEFKRAVNKRHRDKRREKIIETATNMFVESGYESITFSSLSVELEYNRSILYALYDNPADILLDYVGEALLQFVEALPDSCEYNPLALFLADVDQDETFKTIAPLCNVIFEKDGSDIGVERFRRKYKRFIDLFYTECVKFDNSLSYEQFIIYFNNIIILIAGVSGLKPRSKRVINIYHELNVSILDISVCETFIMQHKNDPYWKSSIEYLEMQSKIRSKK